MLGAVSIFHPDQPVVFTHEKTHVCSVEIRMQGLIKTQHKSPETFQPFVSIRPGGVCLHTSHEREQWFAFP